MFDVPPDLAPQCAPIAWLLGQWAGQGHGDYPTIDALRFAQEVSFEQDGRPFLTYRSRTWLLDDAGQIVRPVAAESGYFRPMPGISAADASAQRTPFDLEVVLTHPTGYAEVWAGTADGPRIELRTDVVARTTSAKAYTAGHRMYGLVESDLLWTFDMAAVGQPLQPHVWGRLARVPRP